MSAKDHERTLYAILGEAIAVGPDFMTNEKEAVALVVMCERALSEIRAGVTTVATLSVLSQQALRAAACGCEQSLAREEVVQAMLAKTVPF